MSNVLIADDSDDLLEMLSIALKRAAFSVITVNSKASLHDALNKLTPSVIVLDNYIGNNNGREICMELKQDDRFKNIHIILMSGNPLVLDDYRDYLVDDVLEKPFSVDRLLVKIKVAIKNMAE